MTDRTVALDVSTSTSAVHEPAARVCVPSEEKPTVIAASSTRSAI